MVRDTGDNVAVHFGVGGAGNVVRSSLKDARRPSQGGEDDSQPTNRRNSRGASGRRFSTGIGGRGNIAFANDLQHLDEKDAEGDETARLLYDMQAPGIVLVDEGSHTGIGGAANIYRPGEAEITEARENNENIRRQSLAGINRRRESILSAAANRSSQGDNDNDNDSSTPPSINWNSPPGGGTGGRRQSVADSMKEFIRGQRRTSKA